MPRLILGGFLLFFGRAQTADSKNLSIRSEKPAILLYATGKGPASGYGLLGRAPQELLWKEGAWHSGALGAWRPLQDVNGDSRSIRLYGVSTECEVGRGTALSCDGGGCRTIIRDFKFKYRMGGGDYKDIEMVLQRLSGIEECVALAEEDFTREIKRLWRLGRFYNVRRLFQLWKGAVHDSHDDFGPRSRTRIEGLTSELYGDKETWELFTADFVFRVGMGILLSTKDYAKAAELRTEWMATLEGFVGAEGLPPRLRNRLTSLRRTTGLTNLILMRARVRLMKAVVEDDTVGVGHWNRFVEREEARLAENNPRPITTDGGTKDPLRESKLLLPLRDEIVLISVTDIPSTRKEGFELSEFLFGK